MKNAFSRIGYTCAFGLAVAGAMLAAPIRPVTVTLPHAVTVGATTLPSGDITISTIDVNDGNQYIVVRAASGQTVTLPAQVISAADSGDKTEITLQKDGDSWRFGKLFLRGNDNGYQVEQR